MQNFAYILFCLNGSVKLELLYRSCHRRWNDKMSDENQIKRPRHMQVMFKVICQNVMYLTNPVCNRKCTGSSRNIFSLKTNSYINGGDWSPVSDVARIVTVSFNAPEGPDLGLVRTSVGPHRWPHSANQHALKARHDFIAPYKPLFTAKSLTNNNGMFRRPHFHCVFQCLGRDCAYGGWPYYADHPDWKFDMIL